METTLRQEQQSAAPDMTFQAVPLTVCGKVVCSVSIRPTGEYDKADKKSGEVKRHYSYEVMAPGMDTVRVNSGPQIVTGCELRSFRNFETGVVNLSFRLT
jgi:hypothetical protein